MYPTYVIKATARAVCSCGTVTTIYTDTWPSGQTQTPHYYNSGDTNQLIHPSISAVWNIMHECSNHTLHEGEAQGLYVVLVGVY